VHNSFLTSLVLYESAVSKAEGVTPRSRRPRPRYPGCNDGGINITATIDRKFKAANMGGHDQLAGQHDVAFGEPNVLESTFELLETLCVVIAHVLAGERHSTLPKILERGLVGELHVLPLLRRHVSEKIVEDVKNSLPEGHLRRACV